MPKVCSPLVCTTNKVYVTGYATCGFGRFWLHSSLRLHTVGVSHVAHADTLRSNWRAYHIEYMASEHGKIERSSMSRMIVAIGKTLPTFEVILSA